jgi:excisionase family DNA binding protein
MIDESCRSKRQTTKCGGGARYKQGTGEERLRATVAKDTAPPTFQASGRTSVVTFAAGDDDVSHSVVRVSTIPADIPNWARQQLNDPTAPEEIASHIAVRPHAGPPPVDRLITVGEAATILHVSMRTIRRLIERGEFDAVRIGRSVRLRPANIVDITLGKSND